MINNYEKYILKKPNKQSKEELEEFTIKFLTDRNIIEKANNPEYLHWENLERKSWLPKNKGGFWHSIKKTRNWRKVNIAIKPINEKENIRFSWINLARFQNFLHEFDLNINNDIAVTKIINDQERKFIIRKSVIEEAIASSQIEGAHTSRKVAKEMIKTGREPRNNHEQMIYNNYKAMEEIAKFKDKNLSIDLILELHKILTKNDKKLEKNEIGQFRKDEVCITDGEFCYHEAPNAKFVQQELTKLIEFANKTFDENNMHFIHPIIKAIMMHFWIAYLHPFVDGNGRLARCLFYWYMLKNKYKIISYLPISRIIKKAPKQYGMSFVYSEQDDYDLTYFIDYNIRIIQRAQKELEEYFVKQIQDEDKEAEISKKFDLNNRQIKPIRTLEENKYINLKGYLNLFGVSKPTGIQDLKELEQKEFVTSKKVGREVRYYKTEKIGKV